MKVESTNLELAREAGTTTDVARQTILLQHPSDLVLHALAANPNLDESLAECVRNKLVLLQDCIRAAAEKATEK